MLWTEGLNMKDIFELLNDSKVDFDKYEEVELNDSQKEDIFNKAKTDRKSVV